MIVRFFCVARKVPSYAMSLGGCSLFTRAFLKLIAQSGVGEGSCLPGWSTLPSLALTLHPFSSLERTGEFVNVTQHRPGAILALSLLGASGLLV
jgi:hypothetical protein